MSRVVYHVGYTTLIMLPSSIILTALAPLLGALCMLGILVPILFLMRPRRFYLVRHGETILNVGHVRQGSAGGLSENGKRQAERVGRYLVRFPITRLIVSPYERAQETAAIINAYLKVPVIYSALFIERRNPSEIIGKRDDDPEVVRIVDQMDRSYHDDTYRFSDEENFEDLRDRAKRALTYLSYRHTRETCIVTHGIFLKMFIAYLLYRENLHAADYVKLSFFNASDNANITVCEFHPWKLFSATRGWEVVSYNETPEAL